MRTIFAEHLAERVLARVGPYHAKCPGGASTVDARALSEFLQAKGIRNLPTSDEIKLEIARIRNRKVGKLSCEEDDSQDGLVLATHRIGRVSVRLEFEDFEAAALSLFFGVEGASEKLAFLWDDHTMADAFLAAYPEPATDPAVARALHRFSEWSLAELFEGYAHLTAARQPGQADAETLRRCWVNLERLLSAPKNGESLETWLTRALRTATCPSRWDCLICVGTEIHRVLWGSVGGFIVD